MPFTFKKPPPAPFLSAIIVAGGSSSRMDGIDKQQIPVDQIPVVVRSVAAFSQIRRVWEIVLVCREEYIADYFALARAYELDKVSSVVGGGDTRQESVFRGIAACSPETRYFAIHDGARPLVTRQVIEDCIDAAMEHGAAAAGVAVKDTIKVRNRDGFVTATPDRESLAAIQTPQIFDAKLYLAAMNRAKQLRHTYTDDCQLVEQAGHQVFISPGSYENIKITTPEDVAMADAILNFREEAEV